MYTCLGEAEVSNTVPHLNHKIKHSRKFPGAGLTQIASSTYMKKNIICASCKTITVRSWNPNVFLNEETNEASKEI